MPRPDMKEMVSMAKGSGANRGVTAQGRSLRIGQTTAAGIGRLRNRAGGARTLAQRARANTARRARPRPGGR